VVLGVAAVGGGLANTNLRIDVAGSPARVLLRLYQRDPTQAAKEARLDGILRANGAPTARFYRMIEADDETGLTYAVLEWVPGPRLDQCAGGVQDAARGAAVGRVLAAVHQTRVGAAGFLTQDRRPPEAIMLGRAPLLDYLRRCLVDGPGAARLGTERTAALFDFVSRHGDRLEAWNFEPGLVHGDCNASNFIMAPEGAVAALLDWEFAFSGAPAFDFGNLLRPPLGNNALFVTALGHGYREAGGILPKHWRWLARLADLYAWADFLGRPVIAAPLIDDACQMIAETLTLRPEHLPEG
jgi:aminoglycoside phosphotransferase (APT) family kinase protein